MRIMRKIAACEYHQYLDKARGITANAVYPCSIAEGIQTGEIYVSEDPGIQAVLFWHFCGFGYIAGTPSDAFLEDVYQKMLSLDRFRRLLLITDDPNVIRFFADRGASLRERIEYRYPQNACMNVPGIPDPFQIVRIDEKLLSEIHGRIIPSFSWDSPERFLKYGFGYAACAEGKVSAAAFSAAVSFEEIDIGAETCEPYRGQGLSSALGMHMCREILRLGKRPVWAHAASNTGSMKTALRCGFEKDRITYTIQI